MGGNVLLMMEKGETKKVRCLMEKICKKEDDNTYHLQAPKLLKGYGQGNCWIKFKGNNVINVGYTVHRFCTEWASAIAYTIRKNFKVKKGGWDSVGYSDHFIKSRSWDLMIETTKRLVKRKKCAKMEGMYSSSFKNDLKKYKEFRKIYESTLKKLFK